MRIHLKGNVGLLIGEVSVGLVMLFVGIFMLSTLEPIFTLDTCSHSTYAGSPEIEMNGSIDGTALQNFTIAAVAAGGQCNVSVLLENVSANTSGQVDIINQVSGAAIGSITVIPATTSATIFEDVSSSIEELSLNYTYASGHSMVNVTTATHLSCCTSLIRRNTPAGIIYDPLVVAVGAIFSVFGLLLLIFVLAPAIGSLREMF